MQRNDWERLETEGMGERVKDTRQREASSVLSVQLSHRLEKDDGTGSEWTQRLPLISVMLHVTKSSHWPQVTTEGHWLYFSVGLLSESFSITISASIIHTESWFLGDVGTFSSEYEKPFWCKTNKGDWFCSPEETTMSQHHDHDVKLWSRWSFWS